MRAEPLASEAVVPAAVVRQAIAWRVKLHGASAGNPLWQACERWRSAHPHHDLAWCRLQAIGEELAGGMAGPGGTRSMVAALQAPTDMRRRRLLKGAALGLGAVACGWTARELMPWSAWTADHATAVGERQDMQLADGSRLQLDTRSAVNLRFDAAQRLVVLERGALCLTCADDALHRPLRVASLGALFETQQGRFVVRQEGQGSVLEVTAGQIGIRRRGEAGAYAALAGAGERYRVDAAGPRLVPRAEIAADGWAEGVIATPGMRLDAFLAELGRYRRGYLGCDPAVGALRLSGVYRLDDTDKLLAVLTRTLPVKVVYRSPWWVRVQAVA
ncbi:FecR family protein [Azoarcus indigens]|uniref:FecR family protein n=2 Tax=Azoarcus indigens TaxID=29545 RepID=A0A4R6DX80_9RHOO|nr:FecR family protein [Azoarcus indigens]